MWSLGNSVVDNEGSLVLAPTGTFGTGVVYYQVNEEHWSYSLQIHTNSSATAWNNSQLGGIFGSMHYYDYNFNSKANAENFTANGWSAHVGLNTWSDNFTVSQSNLPWTGIKYILIRMETGNEYSQPITKIRNFKLHGENLYSDFYTIKYNINKEDIKVVKYALGEKDKNYFKTNGNIATNGKFDVDENGTYTVYIEDNLGYSDIKTIVIDKIDKNEPTISAKKEQVFIKVGASNSLISYFNYNKNGISDIIERNTKCIDTSDNNKVVSNTSELAAGSHNISCSVVKANNKKASATIKVNVPTEWTSPMYFEYGTPTASSTTNWSSLGKDVFVAIDSAGNKGVCITPTINGSKKLECFKINDPSTELTHLSQLATQVNGTSTTCSYDSWCRIGSFSCYLGLNAVVSCYNSNYRCDVEYNGASYCNQPT